MATGAEGDSKSAEFEAVTYDDAIQLLLEGNLRYQSGTSSSMNPCPKTIDLEAGQKPFAAFIRCADSRVAPEIVFDQPLGSLFVCGVAGNIPTSEIVGSLEYAVGVLGTRLIVIMGHSSCGAVTAALQSDSERGELPEALSNLIEQVGSNTKAKTDPDGHHLDDAIRDNAESGIERLLSMSTLISDLVEKKDLQVIAGVQDLKSGRFSITKRAIEES